MMRDEIKIITRISPQLQSFFEDSISNFEKMWIPLFPRFETINIVKEGKEVQEIMEIPKTLYEINLSGHILQDNIKISRQVIEDILKRLEE